MKSFNNYMFLISCAGFFVGNVIAMEQPKQKQQVEIPSLQELSAQAVVNLLLTFIEEEINDNNNNNDDKVMIAAFLTNVPEFAKCYVPDTTNFYTSIWQQLFVGFLQSSQIPVIHKITLIKNHIHKQKSKTDQQDLLNQDLFLNFKLQDARDIVDFIIAEFQKTPTKDAISLNDLIIKTFELVGKEKWVTELFLTVSYHLIRANSQLTFDQRYLFLQSIIANQEALNLKSVEIQDLLYDLSSFLRDYGLQKLDSNSSAFVIVHQIDSAAHDIARLAKLGDEKKRSVMSEIFCALMLSDRFTLAQKDEILDEILKSFGRTSIFQQTKNILKFISQYYQSTNVKVSVNSPMQMGPDTTTLLHIAVIKINNNPIFAQQLVKLGANVNAQDSMGRTPLYNALALGSRDAVKLLLKNGAQVQVVDKNGQTPLHTFFAQLGQIALMDDVVELMIYEVLKHNPLLNQRDNNGDTVLSLWRKLTDLSPGFKKKIDDLLINFGALV